MLKKLIKYDIKAAARSFTILYLLMAAISVSTRIMICITPKNDDGINQIFQLITSLMKGLSYGVVIGSITGWLIYMITRFRKNMFQDEGYLMHTLPVPARLLVFSKILTSLFYLFTTLIAIYLEFSIIHGSITYVWNAAATSFQDSFSNSGFIMVWTALISLMQAILLISAVYMSLSIGFRFRKDQDLISAIAMIVSAALYQTITTLLLIGSYAVYVANGRPGLNTIINTDMDLALFGQDVLTYIFLLGTICPIIGIIVCTKITVSNLRNHLNLA